MEHIFWDERYAGDELAYGAEPNGFLVSVADRLPSHGHALDLAAGQGRNAVYLAARGLEVLAVDQSAIGLAVAQRLATERGVALRTQVVNLADFTAPPASFDVISSIFVHLPSALRRQVHARVVTWLKPGGVFVFEAYAPDQIPRATGGPKDPDRLAALETIVAELADLKIEHAAALLRAVVEGKHHTGEASVVQVLGRKG